ncbi:hypothetical protein O7635_15360 [Asanoa sp. WMMD1127]|uniref:hypothetical protein n=1 Tax=Asanoa sp. WMMD1127 TaxID=3016107 RepID=UPI002417F3EF|nr:hypothetical protein [Asanoa sp. WMMD1127]MDG4823233.1 hypothetical protein [Asanoa sp. WMMD1127]
MTVRLMITTVRSIAFGTALRVRADGVEVSMPSLSIPTEHNGVIMRVLRTVLAGTAAAAMAAFGTVTVLASPASAAPVGAQGTYTPLAPARILDSRTGNGAPKQIVGQGATVHLQVAGRGGVPASGVSAVVLNLTVTGTLGNGYLTAYPDGAARPAAASISFGKGWTRANTITVAVGEGGYVNIFQSSLGAHVIADVAGYYSGDEAAPVGSTYIPDEEQWRLDDTRAGGYPPLPGGSWIRYSIYFPNNPVWTSAITAFAVNVTAVNPSTTGYLTTWNGTGDPPAGVSALNYGIGGIWPNSAIVPAAPCEFCPEDPTRRMFGVYTSGTTHWLVDVIGYYFNDAVDGLKFAPVTPQRILDTRTTSAIGPGSTRTVDAAAAATPETYALSLNVTAVAPTANTYLTVWPGGPRPAVSTLNPSAGQTISNGTTAEVNETNQFQIYNNGGSTNVVVDMGGRFEYFPSATARGAQAGPQLNLNGKAGESRVNR